MEIGRDWDSEWKNQWPMEADVPGFRKTILDFWQVVEHQSLETASRQIIILCRTVITCMSK
jgi:hypothetical protein